MRGVLQSQHCASPGCTHPQHTLFVLPGLPTCRGALPCKAPLTSIRSSLRVVRPSLTPHLAAQASRAGGMLMSISSMLQEHGSKVGMIEITLCWSSCACMHACGRKMQATDMS